MFAHIVANYIPKYDQLLPFWELVDDCYAGTIAVKSPEKMERYLRKFPVEARNGAKQEQYHLRCWAADYDNIFKSAIMSMVGVMGKIPANVEFGSAAEEVHDIGIWGNDQDVHLLSNH